MLKVSPKNNGSRHLVAGTELLAPGATLPKHRRPVQDEILLIQSGTAHVWLGDQERDLHAGGLVFSPMRRNSVPAGETPTRITPEQQVECAHLGHSESAAQPGNSKK
jgi:quercetin dioxygenase-like cupin family protein